MPLTSGIYKSAPGVGSTRFVQHGSDGPVKVVVQDDKVRPLGFFEQLTIAMHHHNTDRAEDYHGPRFVPTRVAVRGAFVSRDSRDTLIGERPETGKEGKYLSKNKRKPQFDQAFAFAHMFREVRAVAVQAKPLDMHCARCGHDGERETDSLCTAAGKVFCCEPCCDAWLAEHKPLQTAKPLQQAATVMPEPRFYTWPQRIPVW